MMIVLCYADMLILQSLQTGGTVMVNIESRESVWSWLRLSGPGEVLIEAG